MFFSSFFAKAQTTDSVRIAINNILAPLNKTLIPTGILAENTYPLLELSTYNGQLIADNTVDFSQWRLLYNQVLSGAYVAPVGLPDVTQLNIDYNTASNNNGNNVVSIALINYASIKPTAITDGYMYASNGQLFDAIANEAKTENGSRPPKIGPYQTNRLFIAAAANNTAKNGVLNLLFSPSLHYTNTGLSVSNIQVDFGNGNGFVTANFNTVLNATYSTTGNKQLIYKITFSDGSVAQCYNTVYVPYIPSANNASRYAGAPTNANGADIPDVVLESPTNAHSGVDLFIRRSVSNAGSNINPQFRKPLIIVEGLDLSSATTLLGNGYNYNAFRDEIRDGFRTSFASGTNPLQPFDQYLDDVAGYDLIFVNWHNGVDDILRNVLALRDAINYVNTRKLPGAEQNVVIGISMGGLVSRYCLAQMVKSGGTGINETQTRLLVTHDSPHRGANIPLALQHLLQGLRKQRVKAFLGFYNKRLDEIVPQLLDVNTALNSAAPAQQLLARVVDENGTIVYNTFLDGDYRNMVNFTGTGFTQPYRFVATSNGSQCGFPLAAPYSQLASLDADGLANIFGLWLWTKGRTYLDMRRLPDIGQTNRILDFNLKLKVKILFFNLLKISMQIQQNAPGNLLPLDGLAGGTRDLGGATLSSNLSNIPAASGGANWILFGYSYNYSTPYIAPSFSFVPTTSSLDVANFNAVNMPYSIPVTGLNGSRSANYIAQERITLPAPIGITDNVNHTDFYARTCNWLYNEMESITQPFTCQDFCLNDLRITPDAGICGNSNTYEIANLPPGASVVWSVTPSGIVSNTALNVNPITLTKINSGTITLAANVMLPCSNIPGNTTSTLSFSRVLAVADVGLAGTYITSQNSSPVSFTGNTGIFVQAQRGQYVSISFNIASTQNLTNLRWSTNFNQISGYGNSFSFGINASNYQYSSTNTNIYLYADSPCGPVVYSFYFTVFSSLRMIITASPNPAASGEINIAITKEQETTARPANFPPEVKATNPYTKITITPVNNNIPVKILLFKEDINTNYKINTVGLTAGTYAVTVERNNIITTTKIIVL